MYDELPGYTLGKRLPLKGDIVEVFRVNLWGDIVNVVTGEVLSVDYQSVKGSSKLAVVVEMYVHEYGRTAEVFKGPLADGWQGVDLRNFVFLFNAGVCDE